MLFICADGSDPSEGVFGFRVLASCCRLDKCTCRGVCSERWSLLGQRVVATWEEPEFMVRSASPSDNWTREGGEEGWQWMLVERSHLSHNKDWFVLLWDLIVIQFLCFFFSLLHFFLFVSVNYRYVIFSVSIINPFTGKFDIQWDELTQWGKRKKNRHKIDIILRFFRN